MISDGERAFLVEMRSLTTDAEGREVLVGLSFEETEFYLAPIWPANLLRVGARRISRLFVKLKFELRFKQLAKGHGLYSHNVGFGMSASEGLADMDLLAGNFRD